MVSDAEVEEFCHFVKKLKLDFSDFPEEFGYNNPVLIVVDAVLSINRRYESFVVPRIKLTRATGLNSLTGLKKEIEELGLRGFCQFWNYNHKARVEVLKRLVERYLEIKRISRIRDDLEAMLSWGRSSSADSFKNFNVKGIGFTTFQYLRMMCGAETTKPDVHLKKAAQKGTRKKLSEKNIVLLIEKTAKKLGLPIRQLDHALWKHYSRGRA